jgi:hypothetical protein
MAGEGKGEGGLGTVTARARRERKKERREPLLARLLLEIDLAQEIRD